MRTTLDIDDDVLQAAKELATRENKTAGKLISDWARRGIGGDVSDASREPMVVNGFEILPADGRVVTSEMVDRLLEESVDA